MTAMDFRLPRLCANWARVIFFALATLHLSACDNGEKARIRELELEIVKIRETAKAEQELLALRQRVEDARREEDERKAKAAAIENEHRKQEAYRLAELAKTAIIDKQYQGGQNKGITLNEWSYDPTTDVFLLKVDLSWDGWINSSNHYAATGTISVRTDGSQTTWNPTWVNDQLKSYQGMRNFVGGVVAIGAIGAAASQNTGQ